MNWFRENRFLGTFFIVFGVCALIAGWFLVRAKSDWNDTATRFKDAVAELNRLERLAPYPGAENLRTMKKHRDNYAGALAKLQDELRTRVFPLPPLAPNEFQSHLRLTTTAMVEKARATKVRLPDRFYLGFDEFAASLPNETAAPLLGQELAQIEWLLDALFEARIDALRSFRRIPLREELGIAPPVSAPASKKSGAIALSGQKLIERNVVEMTFSSSPAAARKVLNQIAAANQQFFIVRLVHVRNEKDKGPPREGVTDSTVSAAVASSSGVTPSPDGKPAMTTALNFIVGNEHIETTAKIEMVRFLF